MLTGVDSRHDYPEQLRRVKYYDKEIDKTFDFLTNNFTVPAQTIADLYKRNRSEPLFRIQLNLS